MSTDKANRYTARYWHAVDTDAVRCTLCPHNCKIAEGRRGLCFVRQNVGGKLILSTYGRSSGFCIDPIEKKPLNHFFPGSSVLSFGTAGCNLGCVFCQNWDTSAARTSDRLTETATPEAIAQSARQSGCKSVAFTYNDPVIFTEYAIDVAHACHDKEINTVAVTAGYINEIARQDFFGCMNAANVDLKAFSDAFYKKFCGAQLQPVLDTLKYIKQKTKAWLEITTLLIPGENDSDDEISALCAWIIDNLGSDVPLHFSAFHPDFKMTDRPPTPAHTLRRARTLALAKGLKYVYAGNVHDEEAESTYCHNCGKLLIQRNWYVLGAYHIKNGACKYCGTACEGHFEDAPGTWGSQRRPIHM